MSIQAMDVILYETQWKWTSHKIAHPSWTHMEEAIRRLNTFHHPFVCFWPTEDESQHQLVEGCECFQVVGGEGEYWLALSLEGYFERRYLNPDGTEAEVHVWTSDQGFATEDRFVCRDLERVLRAVRYYHEHGGFDPKLSWE